MIAKQNMFDLFGVDSFEDLGIVVKDAPLQFFDKRDEEENKILVDFFNERLEKFNTENNSVIAQMVPLGNYYKNIQKLENEIYDMPLFDSTNIDQANVLVFSPKKITSKTKSVGIVKQGDNSFKFVEVSYDRNLQPIVNVKGSSDIFSPFSSDILKNNINDVSSINVQNIGYDKNGLQTVMNESYNPIISIIHKFRGNAGAITEISDYMNKSKRLDNKGFYGGILSASLIQTGIGTTDDTRFYNNNNEVIISGNNLINSMKNLSEEAIEEIEANKYRDGRYKIQLGDTNKVKGILKAVETDGKVDYVQDDNLYNLLFKSDQYASTYALEKAKVVDSDIKRIITSEQIIKFNKMIEESKTKGANQSQINEMATQFRDSILNNFAISNNYSDYKQLYNDIQNKVLDATKYKSFLDVYERFDVQTIKARIENGYLFDNRLVNLKDKTTATGYESRLSASFMELLNYMNVDSNRKHQVAQQLPNFVFNSLSGQEVNFSRLLDQNTNHIKELQSKKLEVRKLHAEQISSLFGSAIYGEDVSIPDMNGNQVTYLYGNFDNVFNDSSAISVETSMKNIAGLTDNSIKLDYSALNKNMLLNMPEGINAEVLKEKLQKGNFDISAITNSDSFEHVFLSNLLGEENLEKFIKYKFTDEFYEKISSTKELYSNINSLSSEKDFLAYGSATEKAQKIIDQTIKEHMILSGSDAKLNIINPNMVNRNQSTTIAGATAGLIDDIIFNDTGIEIKMKLANVQNDGGKFILDVAKGTQGIKYNAMYTTLNGQNMMVDALVNNKFSSAKRGMAGTLIASTLETMFRNTMTADFGKKLSYEERLNMFNSMFSSKSLGGKSNLLDILNLNIGISPDGSFFIQDKTVGQAIANSKGDIFNAFTTLEGRIREAFSDNLEKQFGRKITSNDSAVVQEGIINLLYDSYDEILNKMSPEERTRNEVILKNPTMNFVYTASDGSQQVMKRQVNGIVYKLNGTMHQMDETKARKTSNALKLSRISQIIAKNNGNEEFINIVTEMAKGQNKSDVELIYSLYDINQDGSRGDKELFDKLFENSAYIDISNDEAKISKFGLNDTVENLMKSPISKSAIVETNDDGQTVIRNLKSVITGFDDNLLNELDDAFKNTDEINESISKANFMATLDDIYNNAIKKTGVANHDTAMLYDNFKKQLNLLNSSENQISKILSYDSLEEMKEYFFSTFIKGFEGDNIKHENYNPQTVIADILNSSKSSEEVKEKLKAYKKMKFNKFDIDSDVFPIGSEPDYKRIHHSIFSEIRGKLNINRTKEFSEFKAKKLQLESLIFDFNLSNNSDKEWKNVVDCLSKEFGFSSTTVSSISNRKAFLDNAINQISASQLKDFGFEGLLDLLENTESFNTNYYKFNTAVTNMFSEMSGKQHINNLFDFNNILNFEDLNKWNIIRNIDDNANEIVNFVADEVYNLTDGKIVHLNRLKQLSLYRELPFFVTGIMSDSTGRIIPNAALGDLLAIINKGISGNKLLASNKELDKIDEFVKNTPNIPNNNRIARLSKYINNNDFWGFNASDNIQGTEIRDFLAVMNPDVDLETLSKTHKSYFYNLISTMNGNDRNIIDLLDEFDNGVSLDPEIQKKFKEFKQMISKNDLGVSNSLSRLLHNFGVESSEFTGKLGSYLNKQDLTISDLIEFSKQAKGLIYKSNNKMNASSMSSINNAVGAIEDFLDGIVQANIMPFLKDLQEVAGYALDTEKYSDDDFDKILNNFLATDNNKAKLDSSDRWLGNFIDSFFKIATNKRSRINTDVLSRVLSLHENMLAGVFDKGGALAELGTWTAKHSQRFSPRDASSAHLIAIDAIKNSFNYDDKTKRQMLKEAEDYIKIIYGNDVGKEVRQKLSNYRRMKKYDEADMQWLTELLESKQNIVIGTSDMYKIANANAEFRKGQYYAYGLLQRDPSQFHGSMSATRFVRIDNKKMNNNLFRQLFGNTDGINNTANFMFIGKSTGIWFNGDFDGDAFQSWILGTRNQKLIEQLKAGSGDMLRDTFHLHNLMMNSSQDNLLESFKEDKLKNATQEEIRRLIIKLYSHEGLNDQSSNKEVISKVRKYYLKTIYYQHSVREKLADELSKHADTELAGKKIKGISSYALADLGLSLDANEVNITRRTDFSIKQFEELLSKKTSKLNKNTLKEIKEHNIEDVFEAFKEILDPNGKLSIANLFGEVNNIENFLSIGRSGRIHDTYTNYREFTTIFKNEKYKKLFLDQYANVINSYYPEDAKQQFFNLLNQIGDGNADNMFGDIIEKGSIGGKHGAASDPFEMAELLNKISGVTRDRTVKSAFLDLSKSNDTIDTIIEGIKNADNKIIVDQTIGEFVKSMFTKVEDISETSLNTTVHDLTDYLGKMLGINENAKDVKFADIEGLTAYHLAGTLQVFTSGVAKGFVEKVTNTTDIVKGLRNSIKNKKSLGAKAREFVSGIKHKIMSDDKKTTKGYMGTDTIHATEVLNESVKNAEDNTNESAEQRKAADAKNKAENQKQNAENVKFNSAADESAKKDPNEDLIDELKEKIKSYEKRLKELQDKNVADTNEINSLKQQIAAMEEQVSTANSTNASSKMKQGAKTVVEETSKLAKKTKDEAMKHKKGLMIAGAAVILGTFFKIFQSNRPVVNLDINEKQYEKSQGSIYRDLNQYTINTNIRELY